MGAVRWTWQLLVTFEESLQDFGQIANIFRGISRIYLKSTKEKTSKDVDMELVGIGNHEDLDRIMPENLPGQPEWWWWKPHPTTSVLIPNPTISKLFGGHFGEFFHPWQTWFLFFCITIWQRVLSQEKNDCEGCRLEWEISGHGRSLILALPNDAWGRESHTLVWSIYVVSTRVPTPKGGL